MIYLLLAMLALLPAGLLMHLILWMDRNEREPMGMVLKTVLLGGLGFIPAVLAESALGWIPTPDWGRIPAALWDSFVVIAPVEELVKMIPVFLLAWSHSQFNEENDGIVYAASSAMGFAAVENLFYVLSKGFAVGAARAVTSLPLHCFAGVVMGYYIGRARFAPSGAVRLVALGFLWAYLAHAVYNFLVLSKSLLALILLPMVAALVIIGLAVLRRGRAMSLARSPLPAPPGPQGVAAASKVAGQKRPGQAWKAAVGRTLLGLSLLFWALLAVGIVEEGASGSAWKLLAGGLMITFVPIIIGIILEISYQAGRRPRGETAVA